MSAAQFFVVKSFKQVPPSLVLIPFSEVTEMKASCPRLAWDLRCFQFISAPALKHVKNICSFGGVSFQFFFFSPGDISLRCLFGSSKI